MYNDNIAENHREVEDQKGNNLLEIETLHLFPIHGVSQHDFFDVKASDLSSNHSVGDLSSPLPVIDNTIQPQSDMKTCLNDLSYIPLNNEQNKPTQRDTGETSNDPTQAKCNEFKELYASANEEQYPGCDYVTRLDFMANFTYFKVKGYNLPPSYYAIKKTFKTIGLGYESIHACVNDCFLFRGGTNKDIHICPVCKTRGWKHSNTSGKKVSKKVLCYFLMIPRLQILYKSSHTAKELTWHATEKCMEPVSITTCGTYNLPPWLCMKESSFMLTLLIHGPKSPSKDIDVYLRPLIDDLKVLWVKPDVMHIEKNVLESILNTLVMNDKSKDIAKARQDLKRLGIQSGLWLGQNKNWNYLKPQAVYSFTPEDRKKFCQFIKGAKLPDSPEIDTYRAKFKSEFPNKDMNEEFLGWFGKQIYQCHINNDPSVSEISELFALAYGPSQTPISVNSCIVNGVRFVVHSRNEGRTTQNSNICLPGSDIEMYYG
nr:hypothetical protein [Tanacetum cinerariifolium]